MKRHTKPGARCAGTLVLALMVLSGCTGIPGNLRIPTDATKSVIGIAVEAGSPMSVFSRTEPHVYFVKLKSPEGPLTEGVMMESVFYGGRYAYLIDADPGHYIAVASYFSSEDRSFITFFDEETARSTLTEVRDGEIYFMGYHVIKSRGDILGKVLTRKIQKHYYDLIRPEHSVQIYLYSGSPQRSMRDADAEKAFLRETRSDFQKSEWLPMIQRRMEEIMPHVQ